MILRDATERDAVAVARLHAESWQSAYRGILSDEYLKLRVYPEREALWNERFSGKGDKPMFVIVAETGQELVGFVCVFPEEDPMWGSFVDNLHVKPGRTGQGIGKSLLRVAANHLLSTGKTGGVYLWVMEQNTRARKFYAQAGAAEAGSEVIAMPDGGRHNEIRCYWREPARLLL